VNLSKDKTSTFPFGTILGGKEMKFLRSSTRRRSSRNSLRVVIAGAIVAGSMVVSASSSLAAPKEKILTVASAGFPATFDPAVNGGDYRGLGAYTSLAYDPLFVRKANGTYAPGLATKGEFGPQNKSLKITLRSGVKFSDGSALTAAGVKSWLSHAQSVPGNTFGPTLKPLTSIKVEGELSLTLNFSDPVPGFLDDLSQGSGLGMVASPKAIKNTTMATETAGAGQYILDKKKTVSQISYVYIPNPNYWNKSAIHWDKVIVKVIKDPTAQLNALIAGQVDTAGGSAGSIAAAKAAGLNVTSTTNLLMGIAINGRTTGPLSNVLVRQALSYAVDRKAMANLLGGELGVATNQFAVPGDDSYDPAIKKLYEYNPPKAKELLAKAGYPNGFTFTGLSIAIAGQDVEANAFASYLAAIGVTFKPTIADIPTYLGKRGTADFPAVTLSWGRGTVIQQYNNLWGLPGAFVSSDAKLAKLFKQVLYATPDNYSAAAKKVQNHIINEVHYIMWAGIPMVGFSSPKISDAGMTRGRPCPYIVEFIPSK